MKASICMATYNRPQLLRKTLESIYAQSPSFPWEVIVVNDHDAPLTELEQEYPQVRWIQVQRAPGVRSAVFARNIAYRAAHGDILICQSDEVLHMTSDAIQQLVDCWRPGTFVIARTYFAGLNGDPPVLHRRHRPLFFLGSVARRDVYAIGGNDEEFGPGGNDDRWFAQCLKHGRGLTTVYAEQIVALHQYHEPHGFPLNYRLYRDKLKHGSRTGVWQAASGPWLWKEAQT